MEFAYPFPDPLMELSLLQSVRHVQVMMSLIHRAKGGLAEQVEDP